MKREALLRVLVIDDSAYSRRTITQMLERSLLVGPVDWARDGEEALRKALSLDYDLVTLDLEMPRMDGFTFLRMLMAKRPTPVLVISGRGGEGDVFRALEFGAADFLAKPTARAAPELATIEAELLRKVHGIRQLRVDKLSARIGRSLPKPRGGRAAAHRIVAIGSSTGGPAALLQLFGAFAEPPACAFVVSQHMPSGFTRGFAERLTRATCFQAAEAQSGDVPHAGRILVAPGGHHLEFESSHGEVAARVVPEQPGDRYAPSVDRMFTSAAKHFGAGLLAIVLTGMGDDGRAGVVAVKRAGGNVIVESEDTAVIFGMPDQAIRAGAVDAVLPLGQIAPTIQSGFADESASDQGKRHE
jgi:two-component system chemotaxis response regulator CheB